MTNATQTKKSVALAGVEVGETAIASAKINDTQLFYRGYDAIELARTCSFEEVAYLLLYDALPSAGELAAFCSRLEEARRLSAAVMHVLDALPKTAHPMHVLMCAFSALACDEILDDEDMAEHALSFAPAALFYWRDRNHFSISGETHAEFVLRALGAQVLEDGIAAINASLILYAEHEFATSSFTARLIASTKADMGSSIIGALAALSGLNHGGANEHALAEQLRYKTREEAESDMRVRIARREKIIGFGHPVYRSGDMRSPLIKYHAQHNSDGTDLFAIAERIEKTLFEAKGLYPNIDWYSATLYRHLGMKAEFHTPVFAFGRIAGWAAHVLEQRASKMLLRPAARYTGPAPRNFVPLKDRV